MERLPKSGPMPRPASVEQALEMLKKEAFPAPNVNTVRFEAMEFTSVCPATGQPDFGRVIIEYEPGEWCIESKALKFYLWAFRDEGAYCESLAALIADQIVEAIAPVSVEVTVVQNVRGGIALQATARRPD